MGCKRDVGIEVDGREEEKGCMEPGESDPARHLGEPRRFR